MVFKKSVKSILFAALSVNASYLSAQGPEEAAREVEKAIHLTPNIENGKKVFMICTVCHRPEGWASPDGMYPQIAGQQASVLIKQLADIRARNRDNPTMLPFTSPRLLGGAQEIADVAAYISKLPMSPNNSFGPGFDLELGERLYMEECSECHGKQGEGDKTDHIPLIQGQNYYYLIRQFDWIRSGKRRNADEKMVRQIQRFTPREELAVLDYVSRIRPAEEKLAQPGWLNPDFPNYARVPMPQIPQMQMPQMPMPPMPQMVR
ncbi:MAG: c-type cytochrome [Sedimenticola sp.]|uniref:C-type cytochrome n=1 Tax=Sedimenticola thiotaurini TaxID=1543721 RepID=A0A558DBW4_9GAMM|nr:c-type cytochrome [Sedimenticola sp.]MCW8946018.1 c-type cytochrome [Sedimenticola sp.]MCW8949831.1 c-type cytochrome [Sedimenticola sp.]MCW8975857.1 c-type cytochrome [Sedimenticola sp.]TVT58481.1 MAG: c-type cytochrome [Sedimenticola thiotaurini]